MIGERIKKLRKSLELTQQEFSNRIGCSRNLVANYEIGNRNPSSSVINNICKTFNVSESWLRTGEGDMFIQQKPEDELASAVERLITGESADFKRRLVLALSSLKDEHWVLLEEKLKEIVGQRDRPPAAPALAVVPGPEPENKTQEERLLDVMSKDIGDMTDEEYEMYMREVRRQALAEREAEERSSDLSGSKMA